MQAAGLVVATSLVLAGMAWRARFHESETPARASESEASSAASEGPSEGPLGAASIASMDDVQLDEVIWSELRARMAEEKGFQILDGMSRGCRAFYATRMVEAWVDHGGFAGFFQSPSGGLAVEALKGFRMIGARQHVGVMGRAITAFLRANPRQTVLRLDGSVQHLTASHESASLDELDDLFFSLCEQQPLLTRRANYIRRHPEEFFRP